MHLTDDFRLSHLSYPLPYHREWENPSLDPEEKEVLEALLNQPFSYIGKGEQAYVFGSTDGKYVIKFFKFKHLKPNPLLDLLPSIGPFKYYKDKRTTRKVRKIYAFFEGHRIAYQKIRFESGLLFLHLNPTVEQFPSITLLDKMGWTHHFALDPLPFVIQKRGVPADQILLSLLQEGDQRGALQKITQLLELYQKQYRMGIIDNDDRTLYNTGFIDAKAVQIDVGNLKLSSQIRQDPYWQNHLKRAAWTILSWVEQEHPESYPSLKQDVEAYLSNQLHCPVCFDKRDPPPRVKL